MKNRGWPAPYPEMPPLLSPDHFFSWLNLFLNGEAARISATVLVILSAGLFGRLYRTKLNRNVRGESANVLRSKLVWVKNLIRLTTAFVVMLIWASKIAGVILSVAALAGAMLLVHKELLMCAMGYALVMLTHPYKIGDFIEIAGHSGRVIDINVFSTVVSETGSVNQLTGKTLSFPNSLLFAGAVRNTSATGEFIVTLFRMGVPLDTDFDLAEECALDAANQATSQWQSRADEHLRAIETRGFLDLPSSRPKVLWESPNERQHAMTIRFACPMADRVATEQEIFRSFWRLYRCKTAALKEARTAAERNTVPQP